MENSDNNVADTPPAGREHPVPLPLRFGIGDYEWCEPDYRQISIWAEETGLKPQEVVARLLDPKSLRELPGNELTISNYFEEPFFADGRFLKVNLNLRLLPCSKLEWMDGLEITCPCVNAGGSTDLQFSGTSAAVQLSDLGSLPLTRLEQLSCQSLGLTQLNLARVPQLKELDCTDNRLEELQLYCVPQLTSLHCRKNKLTELKFDQTPNLRYLNCWANKLTELDLSNLDQLRLAGCGENRLSELTLANLPNLQSLNCAENCLHELDLAEVPELKSLDCFNNQISQLDLGRWSKLISLNCNLNHLT